MGVIFGTWEVVCAGSQASKRTKYIEKIENILSKDDLFVYKDKNDEHINFSVNVEEYSELYYHKKLGYKQIHYDIAYESQKQFELQIVNVLRRFIHNTKNVIITGGCGLNVVFN